MPFTNPITDITLHLRTYRVFHILPQIYTENHAAFPIQIYSITFAVTFEAPIICDLPSITSTMNLPDLQLYHSVGICRPIPSDTQCQFN